MIAANNAVKAPVNAIYVKASKVKIGNILIVRYTPAATIVAACIIALAGVGPAIASGSQI